MTTHEQSADYVRVERAALQTLLDWYDEPENPEWDIDVAHAAQRLRLQIDGCEHPLGKRGGIVDGSSYCTICGTHIDGSGAGQDPPVQRQ